MPEGLNEILSVEAGRLFNGNNHLGFLGRCLGGICKNYLRGNNSFLYQRLSFLSIKRKIALKRLSGTQVFCDDLVFLSRATSIFF